MEIQKSAQEEKFSFSMKKANNILYDYNNKLEYSKKIPDKKYPLSSMVNPPFSNINSHKKPKKDINKTLDGENIAEIKMNCGDNLEHVNNNKIYLNGKVSDCNYSKNTYYECHLTIDLEKIYVFSTVNNSSKILNNCHFKQSFTHKYKNSCLKVSSFEFMIMSIKKNNFNNTNNSYSNNKITSKISKITLENCHNHYVQNKNSKNTIAKEKEINVLNFFAKNQKTSEKNIDNVSCMCFIY